MLKFQSRLHACISRSSSTTMAKTRKTSYIDKGVSGTRNGMKIFYECVAIIFSSIKCSLQHTLRLLLCSFMLAVRSIIIPLTWFRNFQAVECIPLIVKRGLSPTALNTLLARRPTRFQTKNSKIDIYLQFPCQNMNSNFFHVQSTWPPRNTQSINFESVKANDIIF